MVTFARRKKLLNAALLAILVRPPSINTQCGHVAACMWMDGSLT